ncbi:MAG: TetR/AcrR family transcriptional regulator [Pseudodesulfovibrio sp.]|jgi:AcrR family transcriptional regulator|uniref:TetR family transcriptional regulator n=1 Tax=Pseudodesulfovibrio indicus TaxID=1716143 RepID=A0A126QS81_9BACT|nr:TetR/AcrR family transcriptional regulator [Pseudodesulfovibrio indicus]AMK12576.1 TetR family transcriptional regulator [Pseudodesulfovibrio indicus]TDT90886.1 TetR family transcriptional regulator [Pseudodesulfovibrio indicus]
MTGRKSLKATQGEETRATLIDTGARLFAQNGYNGVSMRTLAAEAGVNLATVGYHFGGKAGLYEAILREIIDIRDDIIPPKAEVASRIEAAGDDLDAKARVVDWLVDRLTRDLLGVGDYVWGTVIISRELVHPSELYPELLHQFFNPTFDSLCTLVRGTSPAPADPTEVVVTAQCIIGIIIKMLENSTMVCQRLGWESYEGHLETLAAILKKRIRGLIGLPMEIAQ